MTTTLHPPEVSAAPARPRRRSMWALIAVLLLAMFAGGFLTGRATESAPEKLGLGDERGVTLVDDMIDAWNSHDTAALHRLYGVQAVFTNYAEGGEVTGRDAIDGVVALQDWNLVRTSEVVQDGDFYASAFTSTLRNGLSVIEVRAGVIAHQWIVEF